MKNDRIYCETVIVADGVFPVHDIPLDYIKNADRIICCDGSTGSLVNAGYIPEAIVGDMDSLNENISDRFRDRLFRDENQEINDLTKAVYWCKERGFKDLVIVGATGKREDHTIGNISLLADYAEFADVLMITDTGILKPMLKSSTISAVPGQQISLFSLDPETEITSRGLRYPLKRLKIRNWWNATLNEATGESFFVDFNNGRVIVYLKFMD
jgi:thiamine pyrophosphokinase